MKGDAHPTIKIFRNFTVAHCWGNLSVEMEVKLMVWFHSYWVAKEQNILGKGWYLGQLTLNNSR